MWPICTRRGRADLDVVKPHRRGQRARSTLSSRASTTSLLQAGARPAVKSRHRHRHTVNLSNSRVLQMVMDSPALLGNDMRVDGFRFDLATILAAEPHGSTGRPFLDACRQTRPSARSADRRAVGHRAGGYQVAVSRPDGRMERPLSRHGAAYCAGDDGQRPSSPPASRVGDLFANRGRKPGPRSTSCRARRLPAHDRPYTTSTTRRTDEENRDGTATTFGKPWCRGVD